MTKATAVSFHRLHVRSVESRELSDATTTPAGVYISIIASIQTRAKNNCSVMNEWPLVSITDLPNCPPFRLPYALTGASVLRAD